MSATVAKVDNMMPMQRGARGPASEATQIEQQRAIAEVQAMVIVARQSPRSEADAINRILESCNQIGLAQRAFFKFPRAGSTVSGSSIHLAVELARCWGNIVYGVKEMARHDIKGESEMIAYAWDLQTNARAETSFIVPHKRDKKGGPEWLSDMRDIYENNANNAARRLREMIFRVIPSYIRAQAEDACRATLERGDSEKPMAQRIADALFALEKLGISRARVEAKIGMSADRMTPVDLAALAISARSVKNGEVDADEEFPHDVGADMTQELRAQAPVAPAPAPAPAPAAGQPPATAAAAGEAPAATQAAPVAAPEPQAVAEPAPELVILNASAKPESKRKWLAAMTAAVGKASPKAVHEWSQGVTFEALIAECEKIAPAEVKALRRAIDDKIAA